MDRTLYHFPLDPASRQARLALGEKRLPFEPVVVRYWEQPPAFAALNPSGLTPVLVEADGGRRTVVCEVPRDPGTPGGAASASRELIGRDPAERAETRRLLQWFDRKFDSRSTATCCTRSWRSG